MKNFSLVLALFILFLAVSCDSGVKFNNPNDINSDTLAMGQEIVDMYSDVDSIDDLCTCFDMNSTAADSRVDCATIDWEGTTSTPCDPNPCAGISNSNGTCTASGSSYTCWCESGYTWNGSYCQSNGGFSLPKCGKNTTSFPCKDSNTDYIWSAKAPNTMLWQEAVDYCISLNSSNYGGYSDGWHLPTISELRTLIENCPSTQMPPMEGFENCGVREDDSVVCLSISCRTNPCNGCSNEGFSKFSDSDMFWSSSTRSDGTYDAWSVYFDGDYVDNGYVDTSNKTSYYLYVRCVR